MTDAQAQLIHCAETLAQGSALFLQTLERISSDLRSGRAPAAVADDIDKVAESLRSLVASGTAFREAVNAAGGQRSRKAEYDEDGDEDA